MSLSLQYRKDPSRFLKEGFTLLPRISKLYKHLSEKPLVSENMDEDQIWTQLNEQVEHVRQGILKKLQKLERKASKLAQEEEEKQVPEDQEEYQDQEQYDEEQQEVVEAPKKLKKKKKAAEKQQVRAKKQTVHEEVDEFLRLEKYLDEMDGKDDENDEDEDEEDEDENEVGSGDIENDKQLDEDEINEEEQEEVDDEDENMENSIFDEMREVELENKDEEIEHLQQKLLGAKDWQMLGEVTSRRRPLNSLLDEQLDFKASVAQHEQMVTKEYQNALEDKIRQRIKDELWDDRARKSLAGAFQDNFGSKREAHDLNYNKSQLGLAELMEHEFKNALGLPTNASEKNAKQELFNIFRDLCFKLDSLTNLSFQPRGFIKAGEIKVSSTIDREEKVPLTYTKSGQVDVTREKLPKSFLSREESTTEEKRARRNLKKQRGIRINKEKQANKPKPQKKVSQDEIWNNLKEQKKKVKTK